MFLGRSLRGARPAVVIGRVSETLKVPPSIRVPAYVGSKPPDMERVPIRPKRGAEVEGMRDACKRAATALRFAGSLVEEGVTTDLIDRRTHDFIVSHLGCYPSPLHYSGFPKSICTSINEVLCHGIPDDRPLARGDILNIDVSVYTGAGYHGDCSDMFVVGDCDAVGQSLIDVTRGALNAAIAQCGPGVPFSRIGDVISRYVGKSSRFAVVEEFTGHGIGTEFHMFPYIIHTRNEVGGVMQAGHTFTIEPVVVEGSTRFRVARDGWTAVALDGGRSAQIEHTVLVREEGGAEVLTVADEALLKEGIVKCAQ